MCCYNLSHLEITNYINFLLEMERVGRTLFTATNEM